MDPKSKQSSYVITICLTKEHKILLKSAGTMYYAQFRYQY